MGFQVMGLGKVRTAALLVLIFGLVGCDHVTKHVAKTTLEDGGVQPLISNVLNLRYVENRDIAFNLLGAVPESVRSPLLLIVGALAIIGLTILVLSSRQGSRWKTLALSVVLAGAAGNYIDRLWRGYVVDFVQLTHWPVFNMADVYVTLGGVLLLLLAGRQRAAPA